MTDIEILENNLRELNDNLKRLEELDRKITASMEGNENDNL